MDKTRIAITSLLAAAGTFVPMPEAAATIIERLPLDVHFERAVQVFTGIVLADRRDESYGIFVHPRYYATPWKRLDMIRSGELTAADSDTTYRGFVGMVPHEATFVLTARWKGESADTVHVAGWNGDYKVGDHCLVFTSRNNRGYESASIDKIETLAWELSRLREPSWMDPKRSPWPLTFENVLSDLASSDPSHVIRAVHMLESWREREEEVCQALGALLVSAEQESVARAAAEVLQRYRLPGLPYLGVALNSERALVRRAAITDLWQLPGDRTLPMVNVVRKHLQDSDPKVREEATRLFARWGAPAAGMVYPALIEGCADSVSRVRMNSASCLGWAGALDERAVPALMRLLDDASWCVRMEAAKSLGYVAELSPPLASALERAKHDSNACVRGSASGALEQLASGESPAERLSRREPPGVRRLTSRSRESTRKVIRLSSGRP